MCDELTEKEANLCKRLINCLESYYGLPNIQVVRDSISEEIFKELDKEEEF